MITLKNILNSLSISIPYMLFSPQEVKIPLRKSKMDTINLTLLPRQQRHRVGFDKPWKHLTDSYDKNCFHTSWIFSGLKGIGKATLAYQMARYILADSHPDQDNRDFYHGLIDHNTHPNLLVIERGVDDSGELNAQIRMEDVQLIREFTQLSSAFPGWRVVIIDGLEDLNRNAANALLKVLEEPPQQTVFFLVCHHLKDVLPTIRSRCRLLPLHPIKDHDYDKVASLLGDISPLERELAQGCLGKLTQFKAMSEQKKENVQHLFQTILKLMHESMQGRLSEVIAYAGTLKKKDPLVPMIVDLLSWMVRRIVLLGAGEEGRLPEDVALHQVGRYVCVEGTEQMNMSHWNECQQKLEAFLYQAQNANLDQGHLLQACFLLLKNPNYFP